MSRRSIGGGEEGARAGDGPGAVAARGVWSVARGKLGELDDIERFALVLVGLGALLVLWGTLLDAPASLNDAVRVNAHDWAPGLVIDGLLLWVVNGIIRRNERDRTISQVGSLSREFALDATRRAREEGWLTGGGMAGRSLSRASLEGADLSQAVLPGTDLSYSDLRQVTLAYADLRGADLTGADLAGADLRWADLRGAILRWTDLRSALLDGAHLEGVDARFASVDARQADRPELAAALVGGFLDDDQVREVRRTFDLLADQGTAPIELFYQRLFQRVPHVRHLFHGDEGRQARKFLQSLRVIVSALHTPMKHVAVLQGLGERHEGYGVEPEHYQIVGETLIGVFADRLGADFTSEARRAWERAFELMATIMTRGAAATETRPQMV